MAPTYSVRGTVERFAQAGGWHYIRVPQTITEELAAFADRGLIAVRAVIGDTEWDTSLLPMGDGTHFIALNAPVRRARKLELGDTCTVGFSLRSR